MSLSELGGIVPGHEVAKRSLSIIFLVDISTSMLGEKINAVNQGIPAAVHSIKQSLAQHPNVEANVSIIKFGTTAEWHLGSQKTPIEKFSWQELKAQGKTNTGAAIQLLCDRLENVNMEKRGYPPICIMISDGYHSDSKSCYDSAIERLNASMWGRRAVRIVLALGSSDCYDEDSLKQFSNQKIDPIIKIENYKLISKYIQWASMAASISSTRPKSIISPDGGLANIDINDIGKIPDIEEF